MQPSQPWARPSTEAIILARLLPKYGNSLSHVSTLVDEFLVGSLDGRVLRTACEFGVSSSDLEFVLSRTTPEWSQVVKAAPEEGPARVLVDDRASGQPWSVVRDFSFYALQEAACCDHLEIIKWIHEHGLDSITECALLEAIAHGHLHVVKWLLHEGVQLTDYDQQQLRQAAENGHLDTVHSRELHGEIAGHLNVRNGATTFTDFNGSRRVDLCTIFKHPPEQHDVPALSSHFNVFAPFT